MTNDIYEKWIGLIRNATLPIIPRIQYESIIHTAKELNLPLNTPKDIAFARYANFTYESYVLGFYEHEEIEDPEIKAMELTRMVLGLLQKQLGSKNKVLEGFYNVLDNKILKLTDEVEKWIRKNLRTYS